MKRLKAALCASFALLAASGFADDGTLAISKKIEAAASAYETLKTKGNGPKSRGEDVLAANAVYPVAHSAKTRMNGSLADWDDIPFTGKLSIPARSYPPPPAGFDAWFKAAVSDDTLYVLAVAKDKNVQFARGGEAYNNDCFELFLDPFLARRSSPDDSTAQIFVTARDQAGQEFSAQGKIPVAVKGVPVEGGWGVEMAVPLANDYFKARPFDGLALGFNLSYNNNDDGKSRQYKSTWSGLDVDDGSWQNPAVFGVLQVVSPESSPVTPVQPGPAIAANQRQRSSGETLADLSVLAKEHPEPQVVRGFQLGGSSKQNLADARAWGANVVRIQLQSLGTRPTWKPENMPAFLDKLEQVVQDAKAVGLKVVPVAFETPGATPGADMWNDPAVAKGFQDYWRAIATRLNPYKDSIWGYDIFNEPLQRDQLPYAPTEWRKMAIGIIKAIREVDPDTWIVYEVGPGGGWRGFEDLRPLPDKHVIYSLHFYQPGAFTHQGLSALQLMDAALISKAQESIGVKYPGLVGGIYWNQQAMERQLQPVIDFQKKWQVPIFVGEFSVIAWAPVESSKAYLSDVTNIFQKHGWSWTYHAFREYPGWSLEHEEGVFHKGGQLKLADKETERAKVLKVALAENLERSQLELVSDLKDFKPNADEFRIYFIGDSITRHGFNKDTIEKLKWDHLAGMAASSEAKDYAHLTAAGVAKLTGKKVRLFFGGGGDAVNALKKLEDARKYQPDLVVVQLGEHIPSKDGAEKIATDYAALLDALKALPSSPSILCTGVWNGVPNWAPGAKKYFERDALIDAVQAKVCAQRGVPFVSVEKYALDPACSGTGENGGVRWHPNDAGQAGYAKELLAAFEKLPQARK